MTARSVRVYRAQSGKKLTEELSRVVPQTNSVYQDFVRRTVCSLKHAMFLPRQLRACEANDVNQVIELLADPIVGRQSSHEVSRSEFELKFHHYIINNIYPGSSFAGFTAG